MNFEMYKVSFTLASKNDLYAMIETFLESCDGILTQKNLKKYDPTKLCNDTLEIAFVNGDALPRVLVVLSLLKEDEDLTENDFEFLSTLFPYYASSSYDKLLSEANRLSTFLNLDLIVSMVTLIISSITMDDADEIEEGVTLFTASVCAYKIKNNIENDYDNEEIYEEIDGEIDGEIDEEDLEQLDVAPPTFNQDLYEYYLLQPLEVSCNVLIESYNEIKSFILAKPIRRIKNANEVKSLISMEGYTVADFLEKLILYPMCSRELNGEHLDLIHSIVGEGTYDSFEEFEEKIKDVKSSVRLGIVATYMFSLMYSGGMSLKRSTELMYDGLKVPYKAALDIIDNKLNDN